MSQLDQISIGRMVAPKGDPTGTPICDTLDAVNAIVEAPVGMKPSPWCMGQS